MTEKQEVYVTPLINKVEVSQVLYCPHCGKALIEFTGKLIGVRIQCFDCGEFITTIDAENNQLNKHEEQ